MLMRVDIKGLLQRLNPFCTQALHAAAGRCVARGHDEVTPEHLFRELAADDQGDWGRILTAKDLQPSRLRQALDGFLEDCPGGNQGKPVFAPPLLELLQDAWLVASIELGDTQVRSGAVLAALLGRLPTFAASGHLDLLKDLGREALVKDFADLTVQSLETVAARGPDGKAPGAQGRETFLDRFCVDFTRNAREGRIDPVFGRDPEIRQMIDILARRRKNNPICVGDPGVGKTAVVEGLALRIVKDEVPETLRGVTVLALDLGLLEAGAGMKGEFEARLKGVIQEITSSKQPVILFVDEAHSLIGAGGAPGGSDAANLLKPALARGELRTIAATTWTEYKKYFEKDPALARRFQLVKLHAPSVATTIQILRGIRPHYERAHQVVIRDDALVAAAEISDRHLTGRFLPDKAIDLLDTSCARIKVNLTAQPAALEDKASLIQAMERERAALERDRRNGAQVDGDRIRELEAGIARTRDEAAELDRRWVKERLAVDRLLDLRARIDAPDGADPDELLRLRAEAQDRLLAVQAGEGLLHFEVNPDVVAQVVSDWTGIPLGRLRRDEAAGILDLEQRLGARIKGQDHALRTLAEGIQAAKAGIRNQDQPLGVFLLAGPSGTGKTETGRALAELLFGSEKQLVTINLSEFQEAHSVSRLVGSPPGYVGYGEGGMLTEAVRQRPYSVVLLDEAEKAHGDVLNLFHQVFDKGVLTDGEGKETGFRNTVILLTSNLAAEAILDLAQGEGEVGPANPAEIAAAIRPILQRAFRPALLARMTVVPYLPLDPAALRRIVELKLERVRETLWANNRLALEHSPAVVDLVAQRCGAMDTGARGIDFILDGEVLPRLSREILARLGGGQWPAVSLDVAADGEVTFRFREGDRPSS
jgi:type VI secretion system protein VasG